MKKHKRYTVAKRRKREGKTNYKKRLRMLMSGKPRLVVRISLKNVIGQIIDYHAEGDKIIASACSKELEKMGWNYSRSNMPSAYLTGYLLAKKALKKKIKQAVLDIGMYEPVKGSKVFGFLKGAVDGGLDIPYSDEVLPSEDRIKGKHIADYGNNEKIFEKQFSGYVKKKVQPKEIIKQFDDTKTKIEAIK